MARVFISHSSRDREQAEEIFAWLRAQGFEQGFLDIDKHQGIPPGERWEQKLYDELDRAQAMILVLTRNWFDSKWCFAEFAQARSRGKAIFPLICAPDGDQFVGDDLQKLNLVRDKQGGLERLARRLTEVALMGQGGFDFPPGRAPYPGFLSFDEDDAAIYFGRDDDVRRLIQRADSRRIEGGRRCIFVLGESGTGKSSLLRAGLIPRLRKAKREWVVLSAFRPEDDPFAGLSRSLKAAGVDIDAGALPDTDPRTIADALAEAHDAHHAGVLVAVDQAEELFTRSAAERREAFLAYLSRLLGPGLPFVVVVTLRSDHFGEVQKAAGLDSEFEEFSLRPMPVERIGDIVRGPARVAGLDVEDGLVARIASDARSTDALPLVAFALRRIYDQFGDDGRLRLNEYESLRDAAAGLSPLETLVRDTAADVIARAKPTPAELAALREAFVPGMVRINDEGGFVRQAARWDEVPEESKRLLSALAGPSARLLVVREHEGTREVEVAHEALFRVWPLLVGWLEEEREFLIGRNRLERALADWQALPESERDKGLISGILLERAKNWLALHPGRFDAAETDFIEASERADAERKREAEAQRQALEAAKLRQAETERDAAQRVQRRTRMAAAILGLVALVAIGAGILAFRAEQRATAEADRANAEAVRANAEAERANAEADRANANLTIARDTVYNVARDVAQGVRDIQGMRIENLRAILQRVETAIADLLKAAPDDEQVLRGRATTLTLFSDTYLAAGDTAAAQAGLDEALTIRRRLLAAHPDDLKLMSDLSLTLNREGDIKVRTGDLPAALTFYREALDLARAVQAARPDDPDAQADVWISLIKIGDVLTPTGQAAEGLALYEEALGIVRGLAAAEPENNEWLRRVGQTLSAVGDAKRRAGDLAGMMAAYEESLSLVRQLAERDPTNAPYRRDMIVALQRIGDQKLLAGDTAEAVKLFDEALAIARELAASDPGNKSYQSDLAIAIEKTADAALAEGDVAAATQLYDEQLGIARGLAESDPDNADWQRGLSVALERVGDAKAKAGDSAGALVVFEESLVINRKLAESDPQNLDWQRDLMIILNRVGGMRLQNYDFENSVAAYEEGLSVARTLLAAEPDSVERQTDLIMSIAQTQIMVLDPVRKRALIEEALAMLDKLQAAGQLSMAMLPLRMMLNQSLSELPPE
ncbi:MAG: TIR domain-containing protein [Bauldia sp.]|nr:TIR domain-containing protein [Bauldia sp.]